MERNANAYYDLVKGTVEAFNERIQCEELTEDGDYQDALREVVDGMVPHYYHEIFTVMAADGIDFVFDDSDMIPDTKDISVMCQARIYEALYNDVQAEAGVIWWEEEESDEEEFWVVDARTRVNIEINVDFETAKRCCDEHYAIGRHLVVEDINDKVRYNPAEE